MHALLIYFQGELKPERLECVTDKKRKHVTKSKEGVRMMPETRAILTHLYAPFMQDMARILQDDRYLWSDIP